MSRTADRVKKLFRGLTRSNRRQEESSRAVHPPIELAHQLSEGMEVGFSSHTGNRATNEDYAAFSTKGDFFAVSDGIGGAPYGDVMSRLACNTAVRAFDEGASINEAFEIANELVSLTSELLGESSGATLLLAERGGDRLKMVSVGDTRAFLLRDGLLVPLTGAGRADTHSNALDKAVGYGPMEPDVAEARLLAKDRLLLCTDGVWEYVSSDRLALLLGMHDTAPIAADEIAWEASRVGNDNSTCICAFVGEGFMADSEGQWGVDDAAFYGSDTPTADFSLEE